MHPLRLHILLVFVALVSYTQAQTTTFGSNVMSESETNETLQVGFQPKVNVSIGTSFSAFSGGSAFNTWAMPQITMPVSRRWNVAFGMGYSNTNYNGLNQWTGGQNNAQFGMLYVKGQYLLNEKVTLTGTAYKQWLLNPVSLNEHDGFGRTDFSNEGLMLDMNYKVTDHFQINVGVEYRRHDGAMMPGMYPGAYQGYSNGFGSGFQNGYYPEP